ncbi:hypothetical protein GCM10027447_21110 [Glycomyces halotolerans]
MVGAVSRFIGRALGLAGALVVAGVVPRPIHWPGGLPLLEAEHRRAPVGMDGIEAAGPADLIEDWCGAKPEVLRTVPGSSGPYGGPPSWASSRRARLARAVAEA